VSDLSTFSSAARGLARNPLGIIALFIVLIYGFAALTLGINTRLESAERAPLVWFLVLFPVAVLLLFGWLVSRHHEKLYSPGDFRSDESFLARRERSERHAAELKADQEDLKARVRETVLELSKSSALQTDPQRIADQLADDIDRSTTITVDARQFLSEPSAVFRYPIATFESLGALTDEVYFKLAPRVKPFHYGHSWVLKHEGNSATVRTLRMLAEAAPGTPLRDPRTLREVGISPGTTLIVERAA
jgi:hypothetical protein